MNHKRPPALVRRDFAGEHKPFAHRYLHSANIPKSVKRPAVVAPQGNAELGSPVILNANFVHGAYYRYRVIFIDVGSDVGIIVIVTVIMDDVITDTILIEIIDTVNAIVIIRTFVIIAIITIIIDTDIINIVDTAIINTIAMIDMIDMTDIPNVNHLGSVQILNGIIT
jgi:hypothetical protein